MSRFLYSLGAIAGLASVAFIANAPNADAVEAGPTLIIKADQAIAKVSPNLYGLMTEEINYSYEGGLYGELIRNRSFKADAKSPKFWDSTGNGRISLDRNKPLNDRLDVSLKLDASEASNGSPAGIANGGYWGIAIRPKTTYRASLYAKAARGFGGPLAVRIESADGKTVLAEGTTKPLTGEWEKYDLSLTTGDVKPSKENRFVVTVASPGTIWFSQVSLFPPTYKDRANGNRPDIMQLLGDLHPKILRFPGGNYLEGNTIETRFNWKNTIGDVSQRPGHLNDGWGYWSTDGLGLLEFLEWCQDLDMQPVLAVYAGYSMHQQHVDPGSDLKPYVDDALDEIEYVSGGPDTTWGAKRVKDGHADPFPLTYVEIGNEDWFDKAHSYDGRFTQFFDAIKKKYPKLRIIGTTGVKSRTPDVLDEHYYRSQEEMEANAHQYDARPRTGPKIFVGEWATRVGSPTPNMAGALGDAAWMTGMERNSDLVIMSSYAPLFVNVSDLGPHGSMQWKTDLIGYDALGSYGSPAYYAQQMFSTHHGDVVLATDSRDIPTQTRKAPARRKKGDEKKRGTVERETPALFFDATRDSRTGTIYLKVVNPLGAPQNVTTEIAGAAAVNSKGTAIVLKADSPAGTNSVEEPTKIAPVAQPAEDLGKSFTRAFPAYSITILEIEAK